MDRGRSEVTQTPWRPRVHPEPTEGHCLLPTLQLFSQQFGGGKDHLAPIPAHYPAKLGGGVKASEYKSHLTSAKPGTQTSKLPLHFFQPLIMLLLEAFLGPPTSRGCSSL